MRRYFYICSVKHRATNSNDQNLQIFCFVSRIGCCNSRRIFFFNAIPNRFQIRLLSYETIFKTIISKRCKLKRIISFEFRHVKLAEKKGHEKTRGDFVAISQAVYAHLPCSARCRSHSEIPSSPTRVTFVLDLRSNT